MQHSDLRATKVYVSWKDRVTNSVIEHVQLVAYEVFVERMHPGKLT